MTNEKLARGADRPALIVGLLLLAVAGVVYYDASQQTITSNYGVGPTAMPYVACVGLVLLGLAHLVVAFRDGLPKPEEAELDMLDLAYEFRDGQSRLGCQVRLSEGLDGMRITLPKAANNFYGKG